MLKKRDKRVKAKLCTSSPLKNQTRGSLAISQIIILIIGIVAFSYAVGSGIGRVWADDPVIYTSGGFEYRQVDGVWQVKALENTVLTTVSDYSYDWSPSTPDMGVYIENHYKTWDKTPSANTEIIKESFTPIIVDDAAIDKFLAPFPTQEEKERIFKEIPDEWLAQELKNSGVTYEEWKEIQDTRQANLQRAARESIESTFENQQTTIPKATVSIPAQIGALTSGVATLYNIGGDATWEYQARGGIWETRKVGGDAWTSLEGNADAYATLNAEHPTALAASQGTGTDVGLKVDTKNMAAVDSATLAHQSLLADATPIGGKNVIMTRDGLYEVTDTGVTKVTDQATLDAWNKANPASSDSTWVKTGLTAGGQILKNAAYSYGVYQTLKWVTKLFGADDELSESIGLSVGVGLIFGKTALDLFGAESGTISKRLGSWKGIGVPTLIGVGVAVGLFLITYKRTAQEVVTFNCEPWEAPTGGKYCEECNKQGALPCSEYQCRSLGQACEIINPGTEEEKCTWVNRNDVNPPTITPLDAALLNSDYRYDKEIIFPNAEDTGVEIEFIPSTTKCVKEFTPFTFGFETNEPAKCKVDTLRKQGFDELAYYFGGTPLLKYNHTQVMSLPGPSALAAANLTLENGGDFELYVKCQDANGNYNQGSFVFKYCVTSGPDTTPPLIVTTDTITDMPVAYNQSEWDLEVYVNEPATCKWSHLDQAYKEMEGKMDCSSTIFEMNAQMLYPCSVTLDGLENQKENNYYFRCKDQPALEDTEDAEDRNTNVESYKFTLIGTQPLIIDKILPNATVRGSTTAVKVLFEVETSAGYKEGESTCYYSSTGNSGSYIQFYETDSYTHSQELWLPEGDYEYYIKCTDLGGNTDSQMVEFEVESDTEAPIIVRAYHEDTHLKIITDEKARCVWDKKDCSYPFDEGITLREMDDVEHLTDWDTKTTYYIKCQDEYTNQPLPNKCSIIVRPFTS